MPQLCGLHACAIRRWRSSNEYDRHSSCSSPRSIADGSSPADLPTRGTCGTNSGHCCQHCCTDGTEDCVGICFAAIRLAVYDCRRLV